MDPDLSLSNYANNSLISLSMMSLNDALDVAFLGCMNSSIKSSYLSLQSDI